MKLAGAKRQTVFLTGINGVVRAIGLLMRVLLSRKLGAEIMGIMELAQSIHMVVIAPLTSGLPAAVSRLTAKASGPSRFAALHAGIWLVRTGSALLVPLLWFFSARIAQYAGDVRILPSLWFSAPCILILGYSAVYNGYCYGQNLGCIPAVSELIEQILRFILTFLMLAFFRHLTAGWLAAVPAAATTLAEIAGLIYVCRTLRLPKMHTLQAKAQRCPVLRLALPVTISRMIQTIVRSVTAILIPLQLQRSGLPAAEATALLGLYNGMVMPILMLPGIFTSALSMVALPRIAKSEEQPSELKRLLLLSFSGCISFSLLCCAAIYFAAPILAVKLYRQAELTELFMCCAPMTILMAINHLTGSALSALGQQKRSLYMSTIVSGITLGLTRIWTANPHLRLYGVIQAQYAGLILTALLSVFLLFLWKKGFRSDGKFA